MDAGAPNEAPQEMNEPEDIFDYWKELCGHSRSRMDASRKRAIQERLKDGYTVEDLKLAIAGCRASKFHQGENDRRKRYDDITLICRDAMHVDQFIMEAEQHLRAVEARQAERAPESGNVVAMPDRIKDLFKRRAW